MEQIMTVIMQISVLVFVVTSMLAMGLNLTVSQIIAPLRNARLVILALVAQILMLVILRKWRIRRQMVF